MRKFLALVALCACGVAFAATSQPATHGKTIANENSKANDPKQSAGLDTSSLEQTIRDELKAQREHFDQEGKDKAEADRKLVEYTGRLASDTGRLANFTFWLVICTGILGAIAVGQLGMFYRQLKDSAEIVKATKAQSDALLLSERAYVKISHFPPGITTDVSRRTSR